MTAASGSGSDDTTPGVGKSRWETVGLVLSIALLCVQVMPALWRRSLWLDEAYTVGAIQNLHITFATTSGQMPLYYLGMNIWGSFMLAPWWLRLPSLISSIAVLVLTRSLARRIGGVRCAVIAPLLLAVSPMFVAKAVDARPYAAIELLVVICWYSYLRDQEASTHGSGPARQRWMWVLTAAATVGPAFHALFFIQFAAILVVAAITRTGVRRLVPASIGCASCTLTVTWMASGTRIGELNSLPIGTGLVQSYVSGRSATAVLLLTIVLLGTMSTIVRFRSDRRILVIAPTVWLCVPIVLALVIRRVKWVYGPRYLAPIAPSIAILAALGVTMIVHSAVTATDRLGVQRSSVLCVLLTSITTLSAFNGPRPSSEWLENWNGAVRFVAASGRAGDCLDFAYKPGAAHQWFRAPFEAAWNQLDSTPAVRPVSPARPFGTVRNWEPLPSNVQLVARFRTCDRLWVVTYHDSLPYNPQVANVVGSDFVQLKSRDFQGAIVVSEYRAVRNSASFGVS